MSVDAFPHTYFTLLELSCSTESLCVLEMSLDTLSFSKNQADRECNPVWIAQKLRRKKTETVRLRATKRELTSGGRFLHRHSVPHFNFMDSLSDEENATNHDDIFSPQLMRHIAQLAG